MIFGIELQLDNVLTPQSSSRIGSVDGCRFCGKTQSVRWYFGNICRSCRRSTLSFTERIINIEFFKPTKRCYTCGTFKSLRWAKRGTQCGNCHKKEYNRIHMEKLGKKRILYRAKNKSEIRQQINAYRARTGKHRIDQKLRKARKRCAVPQWVSKQALREIYINCPQNYTVDHIIPLKGKIVSGLHVPWNLQYLTISENSFKWNKFDGTYENESWRNQCR